MAGVASLIKVLGLSALLLLLTVSLHGCGGCDTEEAQKCLKDEMAKMAQTDVSDCDALVKVITGIDNCLADCCDSTNDDGKTLKSVMEESLGGDNGKMLKAVCPDYKVPCSE
eukprot:gnl/TRDRNA2_/TRDRNA2_175039_c0_seq1.p1 gnl/TRDRNA2_/TRDRNA2_175039_c0~~gnl/TRDRNA2_/TRDRNA2_175039_c0_seq1.p1  ORF type:complete len:112 (-),score=21.96 gnl/TRDRNA2_/TRDRNA2_175039_c0_seq1:116-451(-)